MTSQGILRFAQDDMRDHKSLCGKSEEQGGRGVKMNKESFHESAPLIDTPIT
jgi:hypothetical protein